MANEPSLPEMDPALDAALDRALAIVLRAPEVPSDLRAQVLASVARDRTPAAEHCRRELEKDYRRAIADLNAWYLRRCRDVLAAGSVVVVTIGLAVKPLSLWLTGLFGDSSSSWTPLIAGSAALGMGLFLGAVILQDLFGRMQTHAR